MKTNTHFKRYASLTLVNKTRCFDATREWCESGDKVGRADKISGDTSLFGLLSGTDGACPGVDYIDQFSRPSEAPTCRG
jgi:hypothetical protein